MVVLGCALAGAGAVPAGALPLLSEVYYDAVGSDDGRGFVELVGAPGTVIDGWVVEGINGAGGGVAGSVVLAGVIPADGIFVVADGRADGSSDVAFADQIADFDFQNGPDSILLRDGAKLLDAVGYGVFAPGDVFAGEGAPAPDPGAGASIFRLVADVDTGDNATDWGSGAPTPGRATRVPEPLEGALLLLVGWRLRRTARRRA